MAEKVAAGQYETYLQYQYHEVIVCDTVSMGNYPVHNVEPHLKCTHRYTNFRG